MAVWLRSIGSRFPLELSGRLLRTRKSNTSQNARMRKKPGRRSPLGLLGLPAWLVLVVIGLVSEPPAGQ